MRRVATFAWVAAAAAMLCPVAYAELWSAQRNGYTLQVADSGVISLHDQAGRELAQNAASKLIGIAVLGPPATSRPAWRGETAKLILCQQPTNTSAEANGATLEYDLNPQCALRVACRIEFSPLASGVMLKRSVTLTPTVPSLTKDLLVSIGNSLFPSPGPAKLFVPRQDGIGEELIIDAREHRWAFPLAGEIYPIKEPKEHLAIPMISIADESMRLTHVADPFFGTGFRMGAAGDCPASIEFIYEGSKVPLKRALQRTVWTVIHSGPPIRAMDAFYATALADVPPGPAWLHDIAWQHYDYLAYGGRAWFEDIDAAEKLVPPQERHKVLFTLHGWYGLLGRYAFDAKTGQLDDQWTAFPNAPAVKGHGFPACDPVPMTKAEMHRRIRYAKDHGFRVCLYFADGLTACEGANVYAPDKLLKWGGWGGPDTIGKSYAQNPGHPEVYAWYVDYLKALLAEYGSELDALVWDETFMVPAGMVTPKEAPEPAYVAPAYMRLVRELTQITTAYREDLAFLSSDCIGATFDDKTFWTQVPPYAIMSHGCYQDTHSRPNVWPYALFPNLRNTVWSCNWNAVSHFDYTRFGVEHYGTPAATSNGWQDSKGVARLSEQQRQAVLELFNKRKDKPQQVHWLTGPPPKL